MTTINTNYNTQNSYYYNQRQKKPVAQKPQTTPSYKESRDERALHLLEWGAAAAGVGILACVIARRNKTPKKTPSITKENIPAPKELKEKILQFLDKKPKPMASGLEGDVYKIDDKIIKVAKNKDTSFKDEAAVLQKLPTSLTGGQKLIAHYDDTQHGSILVTNFVEGEAKELQERHFAPFLNTLLEHDKGGVLHGDVGHGNWLIADDKNINMIDYGAGKIFTPDKEKMGIYPDFIPNSNLHSFEQNGLQDCAIRWDKKDVKSIVTSYIKNKANFHKNHAEALKKSHPQLQEMIAYEENLAKVLENPSDNVLECETKRLQTLFSMENTNTLKGSTQTPDGTIKGWDTTVGLAKKYKEFTQAQKPTSAEEKTYFENQNKMAHQFHETLSDWAKGTQDWIKDLKTRAEKTFSPEEKALNDNWGKAYMEPKTVNLAEIFNF